MPAPKSPTRINIWRNEVSSSTSPTSQAPAIQQPSFWKKILKSHSQIPGEVPKPKEGNELTKTEMYSGGNDKQGNGKTGQEDVDSSMDLESGESELGGFRERMERLGRAAMLLSAGEGKGKV